MLSSFIRSAGAVAGFLFGFYLGAALLQVTRVDPVDDRVRAVLLMGALCGILGWLGAPYITIVPARAIERRIRQASFGDLVGGSIGAAIGLLLALLLAFPLALLPGEIGSVAPLVVALLFGVLGTVAGAMKRADLAAVAREIRVGRRDRVGQERALLDTSVIIDGRVADVAKAGFLKGTLLLPRFILAELQLFADSPDASRRERGRRGLEMLQRMQRESAVRVDVIDHDPPEQGADAKLVALARTLGASIMTNDYGLNRVAEIQHVTVLNMNDLAKALRPVVLPSEDISVRVIQEGKEQGQGVGYLEDGTMVVIEGGARHVGSDLTVTVMRVLQTVGGRMIFAHPKGEAEPRRVRAIGH
jgi:uncharacterized protein YacL